MSIERQEASEQQSKSTVQLTSSTELNNHTGSYQTETKTPIGHFNRYKTAIVSLLLATELLSGCSDNPANLNLTPTTKSITSIANTGGLNTLGPTITSINKENVYDPNGPDPVTFSDILNVTAEGRVTSIKQVDGQSIEAKVTSIDPSNSSNTQIITIDGVAKSNGSIKVLITAGKEQVLLDSIPKQTSTVRYPDGSKGIIYHCIYVGSSILIEEYNGSWRVLSEKDLSEYNIQAGIYAAS